MFSLGKKNLAYNFLFITGGIGFYYQIFTYLLILTISVLYYSGSYINIFYFEYYSIILLQFIRCVIISCKYGAFSSKKYSIILNKSKKF